jgi:hypothetical protein
MKNFATELRHIATDSQAFEVEIRLAAARDYYDNTFKKVLVDQAIKGKRSLTVWGQNVPQCWGDMLPMLTADGLEVSYYTNDTSSHSTEWVIRW